MATSAGDFDGLRFVRMMRALPVRGEARVAVEFVRPTGGLTSVQCRWCERLTDLPDEVWLPSGEEWGFAWSASLYRALDADPPSNTEDLRYLVAYEGSVPVGWAATSIAILRPQGRSLVRVLVLGDAMAYSVPSVVVTRDHPDARRVYDAVFQFVRKHAETIAADAVHVTGMPEDLPMYWEAASRAGMLRWRMPQWAYVPLGISGDQRYPGALKSSYRRVLRRKQQALQSANLVAKSGAKTLDALELHRLYQIVADKKESEEGAYSDLRYRHGPTFFALVMADPAFDWMSIRADDGSVVAFNLGVRMGTLFQSLIVGMDRDALWKRGGCELAPAVYQVLHAAVLADAEAKGCRWANLGTSALEGKARLGGLVRRVDEASLAFSAAYRELHRVWVSQWDVPAIPHCCPYAATTLERLAATRGQWQLGRREVT